MKRHGKTNVVALALLTGLLVAVYYVAFVPVAHFTDTADFGGDIWEYQSMAVNFAKGHGIARFGGVEDFSVYAFKTDAEELMAWGGIVAADREHFLRSGENGGVVWFFRPPGYYLFLGMIYKIFGISPLIARHIQLLLLAIVAASLPWIGLRYWGRLGFVSGLIASPIAIASNYKFSEFLYTENLTTFVVFFIVFTYALFEARRTVPRALLVGIALGAGLLGKASLLFIPLLLGIVLLLRWFRTKRRLDLLHLCVLTIACVIVVAPWSLYASMRSGKFVPLSTQTESILLDSHNEYIKNGLWYQEWRNDLQSFYNNDGLQGRSVWLRIANFYRYHPLLLPRLMFEKLIEGFKPFPFLLIGGTLVLGEAILQWWRRKKSKWEVLSGAVPPMFLIVFLNFVLMTVITHVDHVVYPSRIIKPMEFLFILFGVHRILLFLCAALRPFSGRIALLRSMRSAR